MIFTKFNHLSDEEILRMAEVSTDDLVLEMAKRYEAKQPEENHDNCYDEDALDAAKHDGRAEREIEIDRAAKELVSEITICLESSEESVRADILGKLNTFVEGIYE